MTSGLGLGDDFDPEKYRRVMAINLDGVVYGIAAAMPTLRANGAETSSSPPAWPVSHQHRSTPSTRPTRLPLWAWCALSDLRRLPTEYAPTQSVPRLPIHAYSVQCGRTNRRRRSLARCRGSRGCLLRRSCLGLIWRVLVRPARQTERAVHVQASAGAPKIGWVNRLGSRPGDTVRDGAPNQGIELAATRPSVRVHR